MSLNKSGHNFLMGNNIHLSWLLSKVEWPAVKGQCANWYQFIIQ